VSVVSSTSAVRVPDADPGLAPILVDDSRWAALVRADPAATMFHHPAWAALLAETYGLRAFALAGGEAGLPVIEVRRPGGGRRWVALPYTDECAVVATGDAARAAFAAALTALDAPPLEVRAPVAGLGWHQHAGAVAHVLELGAGGRRPQAARNVRRAAREGVEVRAAATVADMRAYYALHLRTRRRQGVPAQPWRFFELLWERILAPGLGSVLLASAGGDPIAGAVFLAWNGTTIYKFGASDPAGWEKRPNHAIFDAAIAAATARGDRRFDFGRTDLDNAGLRAFKASWGARERPLVYSTLPPAAGAGRAARTLGWAIRRGPEWLCRVSGERLYRYAGAR
jgi:CelD/BcsL family acetyltransferase involved in cellulose biosynthesis